MEQSRMAMLFVAFALLSQSAEAHSRNSPLAVNAKGTHKDSPKASALVSYDPSQRLSPPIHTGTDKQFFGPPFPANYPDDKRPVPDQSVMNKLKSPDQPYPALQSKADFDADYVKDENSDKGAWKAQFEYDTLRQKLAKEAADARGAGDRAGKEGRDVSDAQGAADRAAKDVEDARKGLDDARKGENDANAEPEDFGGPPSAEKLERLKKAVKAAEENYEKEQKEFAECERKLAEAKKNLEELKARQVEMEQQLAADTKLWIETKTTRLNLHKAKEEAAHSKRLAAAEKLKAAQAAKTEMDKVLAGKKEKHALSLKNLQAKKADLENAKQDLDKATLVLQKLRGYKPDAPEPTKSGVAPTSVLFSFAMLLSTYAL